MKPKSKTKMTKLFAVSNKDNVVINQCQWFCSMKIAWPWPTHLQRGVNLFELFVKHQPGVTGFGWLQPGRNFLLT